MDRSLRKNVLSSPKGMDGIWKYYKCECTTCLRGICHVSWTAWHIMGTGALKVAEIEVHVHGQRDYMTFIIINALFGSIFFLVNKNKGCRLHEDLSFRERNQFILEGAFTVCEAELFSGIIQEFVEAERWRLPKDEGWLDDEMELRFGLNSLYFYQ